MTAPRLVAVVGPTATGKSAMGLALAERFDGEIIACDSTVVYRGLDIGTDKVPVDEQRGIPHHMIDLVGAAEVYSAARYATDAAHVARGIAERGRVPILVGGTGFYYRALVRGLFPGPARDEALRARLNRVADRRGVEALHRWLSRIDPPSGRRLLPRDRMRIIRALEVYLLTGRPLSEHFAETRSPIAGWPLLTIGLDLARAQQRERVSRRVDQQFARGVVHEVLRLEASGIPRAAHAFSGLVYRQIVEMLNGVRDEQATRALIVQENMRYAKRQLTWFRHEPDVRWLSGAGEAPELQRAASSLVETFLA